VVERTRRRDRQHPGEPRLVLRRRGAYLDSLADRVKFYHLDNRQLFAGVAGLAASFVLYGCVAAFLAAGWLARRGVVRSSLVGSPPLAAFSLGALVCYAVLPSRLEGQWYLFERFLVLVALGAILHASLAWAGRTSRLAVGTVLVVCGLHGLLYADYFRAFARDSDDFRPALLAPAEPGGTLAGMVYRPWFRGHPAYVHYPSFHTVWNHGVAVTTLVDYRFSAIRRRPGSPALPRYDPWIGYHRSYDGRYDDCDWILARGELAESARELQVRLAVVRRSTPASPERDAAWTLYRRLAEPRDALPAPAGRAASAAGRSSRVQRGEP
jgi:hypothetical protein